MFIKLFTCGPDRFDALAPIEGDDFAVNLVRLPRGYSLETNGAGVPYILCPNKVRVYELEQTRSGAYAKFSYPVNGRIRTVRLYIDPEATQKMIFSGEPYRQFP